MLELRLDSIQFSERDLKAHNPQGCEELNEGLKLALQKRDLAQSVAEKREACQLLEAVDNQRRLVLQLAQERFNHLRDQTFEQLETMITRFRNSGLYGRVRLEVENRLDHAITQYGMKEFARVRELIPAIQQLLEQYGSNRQVVRMPIPRRSPAHDDVSLLIEQAIRMERQGQKKDALQVYARVLKMRPGHPKVLVRLQRMAGATRK